ncbi:MAG TPA: hypothetical protein VHQ21_17860 [Rhodanobacteraceae bacterium]|jgi:hypothetical protein|nr:hypothetical protein [Rhodanobacteraceae bacterium]
MTDQSEMTMNALYIRFFCAVLLLATAMLATTAKAAGAAPDCAQSLITLADIGVVVNPSGGDEICAVAWQSLMRGPAIRMPTKVCSARDTATAKRLAAGLTLR